jgi:hypothetical protein
MATPAPTTGMYAGINEASTDTRFPWFSHPGRYLVMTIGARGQKNQSGKFADVWDVEVLKTFRGQHQPGDKLTRMRVQDQYGTWLNEVKSRYVTLLTIANKNVSVPASALTVDVLTAITNDNGKMFAGMPVIVEIMPLQATKSGKEFSPINYFVPTQSDLDGANVVYVAPPFVAAAPVAAARTIVVPAAPAVSLDEQVLLDLGWSMDEITGLDDDHFGSAVDERVSRAMVDVADGGYTAKLAPPRRSRTAAV